MEYEPLKDKKQKLKNTIFSSNKQKSEKKDFCIGFEKGVDESFEVFETFIEYYNKYKNDVKLLMNEQKNIWSKWVKFYDNQTKVNPSEYLIKYNEWLFNYIFSNINEENESFLQL